MDNATLEVLAGELAAPSLFVTARLVVVRDASNWVVGQPSNSRAEALLSCLRSCWDRGTSLLLCATCASEPVGKLADFVRAQGTFTWLPLPPPPKPWEDVRVSAAQRQTLEMLLRKTVPEILAHPAVVTVLVDHLGFKPRQLVQAAERLLLAGSLDPDQVRTELGPGEHSLDQAERALVERDPARLARWLAGLAAGGELVNWRGERIVASGVAAVVSQWLQRLLRKAVVMRELARRAGLAGELDRQKCNAPRWYPTTFQKRINPLLEREIVAAGGGELKEESAWQRQRVFRVAAAYADEELRQALGRLAQLLPEREGGSDLALAMLGTVLLTLVMGSPTASGKAGGG